MTDWADFGEEVTNESGKNRQGPKCKTCRLIEPGTLPDEAREALAWALKSPEGTSTAIRRSLMKRLDSGVPSAYSISRHRRGECRGEMDD